MADQTARLEAATLRAEIGSGILFRFSNDAVDGGAIPTQSGDIQNLKSVILDIQTDGANKISFATTIYPTTAAGIAATTSGAIFLVQSASANEIYAVYSNNSGTAVDTGKRALSSAAVQSATDSATAAAAAAQNAANTATARVAGFHAPSSTDPTTRDDGSALQIGDTYFNTATNSGRTYSSTGWILSSVNGNDLDSAIATREPTITPGTASQFWGGDKVFHDLNKAAVGLSNVDNTSDANKPISTAQQTALNGKEPAISSGNSGQYFDGTKTFKDLNKAAVGLPNVDNTSDVGKPVSTAQQAAITASLTSAKAYTDAFSTALDGDAGAAAISYKIASSAGVVRTGLEGIFSQVVNAQYFGMTGDGSDVTTKLQAMRDYVAGLTGRIKVQFPAGNYVYSASPNWAIRGLVFECLGEVFFTNTGTGYAFILDGGAASPARVDDFCIGSPAAPLTIRGGSSTGGGLYTRAILTSNVNMRCYGCGTAAAALRSEWSVLVNFNFRVSPSDMSTGTEAWYQGGKPGAGYSLGQRGSGEQTSYCRFDFPFTAACAVGIYLDSTLGNVFIGGDSEYNTNQGLLTTANALNDLFIKTNFEQNAADISIGGKYIEMIGCDSVTAIIQNGAKNIQLKGGNWDAINVNAGAVDTFIGEVKYGRGLTGSVITDNGTRTRFSNNFNLATGHGENCPKSAAAITPTTGTYDYQNVTGNPVSISVVGGVVQAIAYKQESGGINNLASPGGAASGQYLILPLDSIRIVSTTVPTVIVYRGF